MGRDSENAQDGVVVNWDLILGDMAHKYKEDFRKLTIVLATEAREAVFRDIECAIFSFTHALTHSLSLTVSLFLPLTLALNRTPICVPISRSFRLLPDAPDAR